MTQQQQRIQFFIFYQGCHACHMQQQTMHWLLWEQALKILRLAYFLSSSLLEINHFKFQGKVLSVILSTL